MRHRIKFELDEFEGTVQQIVPMVDGRLLVDLLEEYERDRGFDVVGGHAGLVLDYFGVGDLRRYLLGEQEPWPGRRVPLLGCTCGDLVCCPLVASVDRGDEVVRWSGFQSRRGGRRDYVGFGPFVFDKPDYDAAVEAVAEATVALWQPTGPEELALGKQSGWGA